MMLTSTIAIAGVACALPAQQTAPVATAPEATAHPDLWPQAHWPYKADPAMEQRIAALIAKMTVEEKVGQVVDSLREQMGEVDEIGNAVATASSDAVDEAEIDEELAELEVSEKSKAEEAKRADERTKEAREAEQMKALLDGIPQAARTTPEQSLEVQGRDTLEKAAGEVTQGVRKLSLEERALDS